MARHRQEKDTCCAQLCWNAGKNRFTSNY